MNHTLAQRRALARLSRSPAAPRAVHSNRRRRAPRVRGGEIVRAAHPVVAGALARIGRGYARAADRIVDSWAFVGIGLAVAFALLYANSQGLLQ